MASLAKIAAPRPSRVHPRERLFSSLDEARSRGAVWIHGPPGAGKTTLIASYLTSRAIPFLWYQVDEGDGDIATFFYYFGLAAAKAAARRKKPLPLFTPEFTRGISAFTRCYFEEFYSRVKLPFAIVFDNYQDAPGDSVLHEVVRDAVEIAPPEVTIFSASRAAPPPGFARLRANGAIEVIEWDALRLTTDEAQSIARLRNGNEASADLLARTQGWAAGLTLLLAGGGDPAAQLLEGSTPQQLFDYFAAEIFEKTDRKTQDFLMETAFLPRVSVSMAQELTAHRDAETILAYLTDHSYFTTRHGQQSASYQYHPLFREFLISRARELFSESRLTALMNDAARLLGEAGLPESAVELWRATRNWQAIAKAVMDNAAVLLQKGRNQTLESWLAACPDALCNDHPWLLYWRAMARLPFDASASQPSLERAFELFRDRGERAGMMLAWAGLISALRFNRNADIRQYDEWIAVMQRLLAEDPTFPSEEVEYQVAENMVRAMYWRMPWHPDNARWTARAFALARSQPNRARQAYLTYMVAIYELLRGNYAEAGVYIKSVEAIDLKEMPPLACSFGHMVLAYYQRETGQRDACLQTTATGLELAAATGVHVWDYNLCGQAVYAALGKGNLALAEKYLAEMSKTRNVYAPGETSWYHYLAAWCASQRGDFAAARIHAQTALDLVPGWYFFEAMAYSALANMAFELDELEEAASHTERFFEIASKIGSQQLIYGARMLRAAIAFRQGREAAGMAELAEALALGRERGYMYVPWWRLADVSSLLERALHAGIEPEFVRGIIRHHRMLSPSPDAEGWPWPLQIYTFGRFAVFTDDQPLVFSRKAPKKPIALLKAIIAFGRREVPQRHLIDVLWSDEEGDAAQEALNIGVHRLRKLLGDNDFVIVQEGCVSLNESRCWVDAWAFERLMTKAETARGANGEDPTTAFDAALDNSLALYRGAFLAADLEEPWALSARERFRAKFIRHISGRAKALMHQERWEQALDCYQRGLEADDLAEEFYQGSMRCYQQLDRCAEALGVYRRMRQTLSVTLGIEPSPASEALYQKLRT